MYLDVFFYLLELVDKCVKVSFKFLVLFVKIRSNSEVSGNGCVSQRHVEVILRIKVTYFSRKACFLHDWTKF